MGSDYFDQNAVKEMHEMLKYRMEKSGADDGDSP